MKASHYALLLNHALAKDDLLNSLSNHVIPNVRNSNSPHPPLKSNVTLNSMSNILTALVPFFLCSPFLYLFTS